MLKFNWLRASPYVCIRTGVWTGWTSVHNNEGKRWLFVVLLVWVYNKALTNLEFGPYGKYLLWHPATRTSLRSVRTAWRHNKYFRVWTALSVNKSIVFISTTLKDMDSMNTSEQAFLLPGWYFFVLQQTWWQILTVSRLVRITIFNCNHQPLTCHLMKTQHLLR